MLIDLVGGPDGKIFVSRSGRWDLASLGLYIFQSDPPTQSISTKSLLGLAWGYGRGEREKCNSEGGREGGLII